MLYYIGQGQLTPGAVVKTNGQHVVVSGLLKARLLKQLDRLMQVKAWTIEQEAQAEALWEKIEHLEGK